MAKMDLDHSPAKDCGDFDFENESPEAAFDRTVKFIAEATADSMCTVLLGGDNGITRPGLHAMGLDLRDCGLLTFDAHHDLRDLEGGLTAGNPIRALLADGLPGQTSFRSGFKRLQTLGPMRRLLATRASPSSPQTKFTRKGSMRW